MLLQGELLLSATVICVFVADHGFVEVQAQQQVEKRGELMKAGRPGCPKGAELLVSLQRATV